MASYDQMSPRDNILAEVEVIKERINTAAFYRTFFDMKNLRYQNYRVI